MGSIDVGVADVHRLIGRAKASSPDPAAFRGRQHKRRYGELVVERATMGTIRLRSTPPQRSDTPLIAFYRAISGALNVAFSGQTYTVAAGECVLMLSTRPYDFVIEDGELSQVLVPLRLFAPTSIADLLAAIDTPSPPSLVNATIWTAIDALIDAPDDEEPDAARDQELENLVVALLTQVALNITQARQVQATRSPVLTAALLYLEDHLADPELDLDSMAAGLGTSPRTLHREFRAIGTSPIAALRDARLTAVARRLSARAALPSLDALAHDHGYGDRTALTRAFRRRFGRSPLEHRRRVMPFPEPALPTE